MNLYHRNLRRMGIWMICVALGDLVFELVVRRILIATGSPYAALIPRPWGIWVKNLIGAAAGAAALFVYRRKGRYTCGTLFLAFLCISEMIVDILSMTGTLGRRTNGIFDITMLMMILLTYTLSQTNRDLKRWNNVRRNPPAVLDLRLMEEEDFFDPIQVGPKMAISREYAATISRYISAMKVPSPLEINLLCAGHVTDNMRDMMREVLRMHFEAAEDSVVKQLESRYNRVMILVTVSVFVIGVVRQTSMFTDEMIALEIIGNFAAFGLWQIGYTHYERNEGYEELLNVHTAKYAHLNFIER
ncbi:MAG: hypothetical protein IKI84_09505 [Clostridia bacterium]|nr:hypothetical protein [Clostridia bacterium]